MGKHYVPQRYLRGFEDRTKPGWIWMYDKQLGTRKQLPIKQVAQEPDFYSPDVEEALNEHVEKPANAVIDKLRAGGGLTDQDRATLAYYVDTMVRRVPITREMAYRILPQVLTDTVREVKDFIEAQGREGRLKPETVAARLAEADAYEKKYRETPPSEVVERIESPWPTERTLALIFSMKWRFLSTKGPSFFLTSDNPAYFFDAFGVGTPKSELVFPICSDLLLHCSWQEIRYYGIRPAKEDMVKELNRRIAFGATSRPLTDSIFEKGVRMSSDKEGSGNGLYLAKLVARQHSADLSVSTKTFSRNVMECTFTLRIPEVPELPVVAGPDHSQ